MQSTAKMNVLSLFDGMSCGQIALKELGIKIDTYYASEVDKFAIAQTQLNFPDTIQLGDVRNIDARKLGRIDLLIGGSPCQSFSFAGKRAGMSTKQNEEIYTLERYLELKRAGFEFEGESYLFWEYMRVLEEIRETNPDVLFLLENVEMGKKWESVLNEAIGLSGVHINSSLVSAQNRRRIYWTNIKTRKEGLFGDVFTDIPQPSDKGLLLHDIIDEKADKKYFLSNKALDNLLRHKVTQKSKGFGYGMEIRYLDDKSTTVAVGGKGVYDLIIQRPRGFNKGNIFTYKAPSLTSHSWEQNNLFCISSKQRHATVYAGKSSPLVAAMGMGGGHVPMVVQQSLSKESGGKQPYQQNRIYSVKGKSPALCSSHSGFSPNILSESIRRLTPGECARLQTIPEWYKWECSETQQYKMLGNGWTVEVIKHIFKFLKPHEKDNAQ